MRELIRKIVWKERSLPVDEEKLLKYRSQMREVQSAAQALQEQEVLNRKKTLCRIVKCFSLELYSKYTMTHPNLDDWTYGGIMSFLSREVTFLRTFNRGSQDYSTVLNEDGTETRTKRRSTTMCGLIVDNSRDQKALEEPHHKKPYGSDDEVDHEGRCHLHGRTVAHLLRECNTLKRLAPNKRRRIIREAGCCYLCMGNHMVKDCDSDTACEDCGARHHTLLCQKEDRRTISRDQGHVSTRDTKEEPHPQQNE